MIIQTLSRVYVIFHGRFPSEKAAALFAAEEVRSFTSHERVVLLVPHRFGSLKESPHKYYQIPKEARVIYLPTLDFFYIPLIQHIAFHISYLVFSFACFMYLSAHARSDDAVITNEPLPALFATFLPLRVLIEVHDFPKNFKFFYKKLFSRVTAVLSTNKWKREELIRRFNVSPEKVFVERNGVDTAVFKAQNRDDARKMLNLRLDQTIALYTGHFYSWKGTDVLAQAAALLPDVNFYFVGGTKADIAEYERKYKNMNIHIVGYRPHSEIPLWQAAADVLILPNTAKEEISSHHTSPMKLFEYMSSGRPIVCSKLVSIQEILPKNAGYYFEPDDVQSLAGSIQEALSDPMAQTRVSLASDSVQRYTWQSRAERILKLLSMI